MKNKPNFSLAYTKANILLANARSTGTIPFHPKDLIKEKGDSIIVCRSFSKAEFYGLNPKALGSDSAVLVKFHGKYIIFYNDAKPLSHVKFSILHEYGHFLLNHNINCKDKTLYEIQEVEANFFAAQMLMPDQIIREFQKNGQNITCEFIMKTFEICEEAAKKRIEFLKKTFNIYKKETEKEFDDVIRIRHLNLIKSICQNNNTLDFEDEIEMANKRNQWYY